MSDEPLRRRLEDAITYLIASSPSGLTRTALIKLLYFADLRSYESRRRPVTGLPWIWHYFGPFATQIYDAANSMNAADEVRVAVRTTTYGNPEYRLRRGPNAGYYGALDDSDRAILVSVIQQFGRFPAQALRDLSYQTAPMSASDLHRGDPIDFRPYLSERPPPPYKPNPRAPRSSRINER